MTSPDRPNFDAMLPREFGGYIRSIFELTPREEIEAEEAELRVRARIHELPLGVDIAVLDEKIEEVPQ